MKLKAKLTIIDTKTGKIELEQESKSWVIQFLQLLAGNFQYPNSGVTMTGFQIRDTTNNLRTFSVTNISSQRMSVFSQGGQTGSTLYGIVLGTGVGADDPLQYQLGNLIADGVAPTNLQYGTHHVDEPIIIGDIISFNYARTVMNGSGAPITVTEVGIYTWCDFQGTARYFMLLRDLLTVGVTIANGGIKTIRYTISADNSD